MELNKTYHEDCSITLDRFKDEEIDLVVTSPPYYNVREYSQYDNMNVYMNTMKEIFTKIFYKLKNHRAVVINVGDIIAQRELRHWSVGRVPLGAYFTVMMEEIGFTYVDNYIWDKGESPSKRHLNNQPYPFQHKPINAFEHILIFEKNVLDKTKIACPTCNKTIVVSNSQKQKGVQSWECKNPECSDKSKAGRGKRFTLKSINISKLEKEENQLPNSFSESWRRDVVQFAPAKRIDSSGNNTLGHTAPFPESIPEMAIRLFSGVGELVYDPFMGSGTTGLVAKQLDRKYIGSEIHEDYVNLANSRINEKK